MAIELGSFSQSQTSETRNYRRNRKRLIAGVSSVILSTAFTLGTIAAGELKEETTGGVVSAVGTGVLASYLLKGQIRSPHS